jgi:hypothetical protein
MLRDKIRAPRRQIQEQCHSFWSLWITVIASIESIAATHCNPLFIKKFAAAMRQGARRPADESRFFPTSGDAVKRYFAKPISTNTLFMSA